MTLGARMYPDSGGAEKTSVLHLHSFLEMGLAADVWLLRHTYPLLFSPLLVQLEQPADEHALSPADTLFMNEHGNVHAMNEHREGFLALRFTKKLKIGIRFAICPPTTMEAQRPRVGVPPRTTMTVGGTDASTTPTVELSALYAALLYPSEKQTIKAPT